MEKIDLDLELNLSIQPISKDDTLNELLDNLYNGKIDALISARVPSSFLSGSSNVVRLFPNYYEVEKEYYRRTKLFPIMHLIVVRNKILEKHPWVAGNLLKAFELSKKLISEEISSNCCVKDHFTVPT